MSMELDTQENLTGPLSRSFVRDGVPGNYEIVFEMVRVIRNAVDYDIGLKHLAASLIANKHLNSYSTPLDQLTAIYNFVQSNVEYIQDGAGLIENIKSARVTISDSYGDCDDLTDTVASLVGCLGFEDVRIALAKYSTTDTSFVHVYPVVYINGQRIPMDASLPKPYKIGDEVTAIEIKEIPVFENVQGLDGISGLFNNLKYHGKRLGKTAIETIPTAAEFLPLGFVSGHAFATGARLLNHSISGEMSLNAVGSKINQELDKIIVCLIRSQIAIDMAKSYALQVSSQLSAVSNGRDNRKVYDAVKGSIQTRLEFINSFETFAKENHIPVVKLNPTAMLAAGVAGAGVGVYVLYKVWKDRREVN